MSKEPKAFKARLVHRVLLELKVLRVFKDIKVRLVLLVAQLSNTLMIVTQQTQNLVTVSLGSAMLT